VSRHILDVDDLAPDELADVLDLAEWSDPPPVLAGAGVALIFEKPSNRTRNASEMAVVALGGHPISIRGEEIGLGVRETPEDVVRVLARYHAVVGARVDDHRTLEAMAATDQIPVINLLSDVAHPSQALADLLTLRQQWGTLKGRTVAWVGDGNNVARSLLLGCAMSGVDVRLATPAGHAVDPVIVDGARAQGIGVVETTDPAEAVAGADAVSTDVWVSMGQEDESASRLDAFAGYRVDRELMAGAAPGAVFLHCLPAHRGLEVDAGVIDGPGSLVWQQAGNRMHAMRGLLLWLRGERP
jgi:ornithine carbamoyltransferase